MNELTHVRTLQKFNKRMSTHAITLDILNFERAYKQREWERVERINEALKVGDRIEVWEVIRSAKQYTGNMYQVEICSIRNGKDAGINPLCSKIRLKVVCRLQLGIPSVTLDHGK